MRASVALLIAFALTACGGPGDTEVLVKGFRFQPREVTVGIGETVTWSQQDDTLHTVTSEGLFDSKDLAQGETFSFTFERAGSYRYLCEKHPEGMRGTVTVTE
ncbi:MAG TPA: cupredoxin domain-containing protein [Actinomycetota bacterium]|jgi:plastocyanin|nr:cupredoxin domain-containing protein [Actinomycetota bacterium]